MKQYYNLGLLIIIIFLFKSTESFSQTGPAGVNTGIKLWLDAEDINADGGATNPANGTEVLAWSDKSGSGNILTGTTGNAPSYTTNGGSQFNNKAVLDFDYDETLIYDLVGAGEEYTSDHTVFIVFEQQTSAQSFSSFFSNGGTNSIDENFQISLLANQFNYIAGSGPNKAVAVYENQVVNQIKLYAATSSGTALTAFVDGGEKTSVTLSQSYFGKTFDSYRVNINRTGGSTNDAAISEIIIYDRVLDNCEIATINNYLGVKYGKDFSGIPDEYDEASATSHDNPHSNSGLFTGIGLFAASGCPVGSELISDNAGANGVLGGLTVNITAPYDTNNNLDLINGDEFTTFGFDSGGLSQVPSNAPGYETRIERTWAVDQDDATGTDYIDNFNVNFNVTGVATGKTKSSFALLIDDDGDGDFSNARIHREGLTVVDDNNISFSGVDFDSDGAVFTLATDAPGPGNVSESLALWLKADLGTNNTTDGANVDTWLDQSGNAFDVTAKPGFPPTFQNDALSLANFNPAVLFDGTDDVMERAARLLPNTADSSSDAGDHTLFTVAINSTGGILINQESEDGERGVPEYSVTGLYAHDIDNNNFPFTIANGNGAALGITNIQSVNKFGLEAVTTQNGKENPISTLKSILLPPFGNRTTFGGKDQVTQDYFGGRLLEVIAYESNITLLKKSKIESYLAIKYGVTLNNGAATYIDGVGNTVWPLDTSYANAIFGIAKDDVQALHQQISKSINFGSILTVSTDADFTAANGSHSDLDDGQFLMIANNNQSGSVPGVINSSNLDLTKYYTRALRQWKSVNTGTTGEVNLQFDGFDDTWVLLSRADDDFTATTGTTETALTATGTVATTLTGTSYFTLAKKVTQIEFEKAIENGFETAGDNLPNLIINGTLYEDTDIDIEINASSTATPNTDFDFGGLIAPNTITVSIPAATYTSDTPIAVSSLNVSGGGSINFAITTDTEVETGGETINMTLSNAKSGLVIQDADNGSLINTHEYTITDDDVAIEFETAVANDLESNGGNLPNLIIDGVLLAETNINILIHTNGTATAGTDYTLGTASGDDAQTVSITIPAGTYTSNAPIALSSLNTATGNPIAFTITDDTEVETGGETINITLSDAEGFLVIQEIIGGTRIKSHEYTIDDDDVAIEFQTTSDSDDEASGGNLPNLLIDGVLLVDTNIDVILNANGTASAGTDYIFGSISGSLPQTVTVTIPAATYVPSVPIALSDLVFIGGSEVSFAITDDVIVEDDETINLTLTNAQGILVIQEIESGTLINTHEYTIVNDDTATVSISADTDADESIANRSFTVTMSEQASTDVEIGYTLTGTATNPADYSDNSSVVGTVTIPAGSTTATIDLTVDDDFTVENTETIIATLSAVTNNASVTATTLPATLNIIDNDTATISIVADTDADESTASRAFTLSMSTDASIDIVVDYELNGEAENTTDYNDATNVPGTVTIPAGSTSITIDLTIDDDEIVESTETIIATLTSATNNSVVTANNTPVTLNIIDNDTATVSVEADADADESVANRIFTVTISNEASTAIEVSYTLTGDADNHEDYSDDTAVIGTVSIPPGDLTATIDLSIEDDDIVEPNEMVIATLTAATNNTAVTADITPSTMFILENDNCAAPIGLSVSDIQITTVDLAWSAVIGVEFTGYEWLIVASGENPLNATIVASGSTTSAFTSIDNASNLEQGTAYDFYMRTVCSANFLSDFSVAQPFSTLPDTDSDGITDDEDTDDDGDGINDADEALIGTDPLIIDSDGNGTPDGEEDFDGDALNNASESDETIAIATDIAIADGNPDITFADTDRDGIENGDETDADGDGQSDEDEEACGSDRLDPNDSAPDMDGDMIPDCVDEDIDGDGQRNEFEDLCGDLNDKFDSAITSADADGDNIPDCADTDDDNDGIVDFIDPDDDNDGQTDEHEIACGSDPLDDQSLSADADGDNIPDCIDEDSDDDGQSDQDEISCGSDPLDESSLSPDNDLDRIPDCIDSDNDNDGTPDIFDEDDDGDGQIDVHEVTCGSNPTDSSSISLDTDGDLVPDCVDEDDDGDGTPDDEDAFPLDPTEDKDTDGDGIGDNADEDADDDGILDIDDLEPTIPYDPLGDDDGDGFINSIEDYNSDGNPYNDDLNNNGIGEFLEPYDPNADYDGDGVNNGLEDYDGDGDLFNDDCDEDGTPDFLDSDACGIIIAGVISPNGDGINDSWVIQGIESFPLSIVNLYNRYGHEVLKVGNYQNDWKGNYQDNTDKLPAGSYFYVIDLGDGSKLLKGWILISY